MGVRSLKQNQITKGRPLKTTQWKCPKDKNYIRRILREFYRDHKDQ